MQLKTKIEIKINETKSCFFVTVKKSVNLQKDLQRKREKTKMTNIRKDRRDIMIDPADTKKVKREFQKQFTCINSTN